MKKINVALVGLGFGGAFAEIYKEHPNVGELTIYDTNRELAERFANHLGGAKIAENFGAILADDSIDAVHLVTPIPLHANQSVAVLEAGKHCAWRLLISYFLCTRFPFLQPPSLIVWTKKIVLSEPLYFLLQK